MFIRNLETEINAWYKSESADKSFTKIEDEYQVHLIKNIDILMLMVVSVSRKHRGRGICKDILQTLENVAGNNLVIDNVINEDLAKHLEKRGYTPYRLENKTNYKKIGADV